MTFSSRLTPIASKWRVLAVGLGVLTAGCSHQRGTSRPTVVFVSSVALAKEHPQWADVVALDRQIAYLQRYNPKAAASAVVAFVQTPPRPAEHSASNVAKLQERIESRLESVYGKQRQALKDRLARIGAKNRAAEDLAYKNSAFDKVAAEMTRVAQERGATVRNLDARVAAYDSLIRTYTARGWDLGKLPAERQKVADQIESVRATAKAEILQILDRLEADFKSKARDEASQQAVENLRLIAENRDILDSLDAEVSRQKELLVDALGNIGAAHARGILTSSARFHEPAFKKALPVTPVNLNGALRSLRARRAALAAFIVGNTQAVVRSAASKRGLGVVFEPQPGLRDLTDQFRAAVRSAPTRMKGLP